MACFLLLLTLALIPPAGVHHKPGSAFPFRVFSAEMVTASPVLSPVRVAIYRTGNRLRVNLPQGGYQIYDLRRHRAYWIRGTAGAAGDCSPVAFGPPPGVLPFLWRGRVTRKRLGPALLYGHRVEIEQITVHSTAGTRRGGHVFTAWLAQDLEDFPLRVQFVATHGPLEINYREVRLGAAPIALLRLPAGCHGRDRHRARGSRRSTGVRQRNGFGPWQNSLKPRGARGRKRERAPVWAR